MGGDEGMNQSFSWGFVEWSPALSTNTPRRWFVFCMCFWRNSSCEVTYQHISESPANYSEMLKGIALSWMMITFTEWTRYTRPFKVKFISKHDSIINCPECNRTGESSTWWSASHLKEKLPHAFMQIGWMEDDIRNLAAKVWANFDNPIKSYDFSKVLLISYMSPSQVELF